MIVRCENCGTEFGFDDRQIGEGITVRCSVCKHVFKVESPSAAAQGWQIRTTDAMSFTAPDVATLREWIDEGRLHPDDQVSRTGRNWVRLGDMPEFARSFAKFQGVTPVASPVREADPARAQPAEIGPPPGFGLGAAPPSHLAPGPAPGPGSGPGPRSLLEHASRPPSSVSTLPPVTPQSQRPTLSPPRSVPAQAAAPIAGNRPPSAPARPASGPARPAPGPTRASERPVIPPSTRSPHVTQDDDELLEDLDEVDDDAPTAAAIPAATKSREPSAPRQSEQPRRRPAPEPEPEDVDDDAFESDTGKRRGISPGLIALLGVIAAVGVMFGVPSIRTKLLSLGQDTTDDQQAAKPVIGPEIQAAELALQKLGTAALARAEADLQLALDAGTADPTTTAAMKVTLADLLLSRAIAYEIAAALDADQRDSFRKRAAQDYEAGTKLIDTVEGAPDVERLAEVRALARLAAGRPDAEVLPSVPDAAIETKLIVQAAILWQDLDAPVPIGLVAGLGELRERSGLGESALALALVRAKDTVAARNAAERLLVGAEDQIVALAVRAHLAKTGEPEAETGETGETGEAAETGAEPLVDPNIAKAPPRPGDEPATTGGSGGSSGASFDTLVERGCKQVRSGDEDAGIKTLMRAFDLKDNNLDVLVCLADGYAAKGQNTQAANFYDRALDQSPSNIPALRGAAKLAAKSGANERAKDLYERLLAADPQNATAKAFLAKHAPQDPPPAEPSNESATPPGG